MPFKIVRNDITKVKADVIVNTANPNPICASGTDLAIYEAAGKEKLLAERANIGKIARGDIDSYIDANYVRESHRKEYLVRNRSNARRRELSEEAFYEEMLQREAEDNYPLEEDTGLAEPCMLSADISLEDQLANIGVSFHDKLFELIDEAHLDNKDVWKRANLDRKHFSKIQCDQNYHPKKKTVMALCIALQLDLEQSKDLLARADWAFSPSSKVDLIVQKAIIDKQYDIMQLNVTLFKYTNEILGV